MNRLLTILLTVALPLAGCLGAGDGGGGDGEGNGGGHAGDGGSPGAPGTGGSSGGTGGGAGGSSGSTAGTLPSVVVPPVLQLGEWWKVRVTSPLLDAPFEWTRVVAGIEGSDYLFAQPRDEWSTFGLLFHAPGLGEVARGDLSYEAHDVRFHPFKFPLVDGQEWSTAFEGNPVDAQVSANDDGTIDIWYCCGANITATYDPAINAESYFEVEGLMTYEVLEHGFGYEGIVTVPHGHDLIFIHGRLAGVVGMADQEPAAPVEDVVVDPDYQRVSFVQLVGDADVTGQGGALPVGGAYSERVTGPDGSTYETTHLPSDGFGLTVRAFEVEDPGGTWTFEHIAPGPGVAFTEGIAYHVFDVELPSGRLLEDHSEHVTE